MEHWELEDLMCMNKLSINGGKVQQDRTQTIKISLHGKLAESPRMLLNSQSALNSPTSTL